MNKSKLIFLSALALFSFSNCGEGDKGDEVMAADTTKTEAPKSEAMPETFFQVPSPGEMLTFIKMVGGTKSKDISFLNPPANEKNYTDAKMKALNFGIFSCDLSYCSIFEMGSESLKYFRIIKTMGDQIGVSTAIKPEILKRLERNIGSPDSLAVITDDVYFSSFDALEDGQQGPTLALLVAGGWIESIYIATNLAKYQENSPIMERLADQKYTLENMIEFLKKHQEDKGVAEVKTDFEGLLAEFNKIEEKDATQLKSKAPNAKLLEGGKQLSMSQDVYNAITEKIKSIRNSYTLTK